MTRKNTDIDQPTSSKMTLVWRILSILVLLAAIGYIILQPFEFPKPKSLLSYVDDFFVFMAAFMLVQAAFQSPKRKQVRRQLIMLALLFIVLAICWLTLLTFFSPQLFSTPT